MTRSFAGMKRSFAGMTRSFAGMTPPITLSDCFCLARGGFGATVCLTSAASACAWRGISRGRYMASLSPSRS
jgi:hypothetical protein